MKIKISTKSIKDVSAEIIESWNPKTARAIIEALPIKSYANLWGDEIYFCTGLKMAEENSKQVVENGDLAY